VAFSWGSLTEQFNGPGEQPGAFVIGARQPSHKSDDTGEFVEPFGTFSATSGATLGGWVSNRPCFPGLLNTQPAAS